jgi:thiamine pyrophosphate-dependent acetolactate synthase large subunit-like protein
MSDNTHRMNRFDLSKRLVARLHNAEAVIGGIGHTNFDLWSAGHRPQNFYMLGSMGLAVPIALGVALAQPQRHVFALEGDGSILMQLGCLATVATLRPRNLTILVMDDGTYQITGGQATPAAGGADYVAIARGCGLANSVWAKDETDFERLVEESLAGEGPNLIGLKLDDAKPPTQTERDPAQIRDRFMRGMGVKKSLLPG